MSDKQFRVAVIIISDRASSGEREDQCLPVFRSRLAGDVFTLASEIIVSDSPNEIAQALRDCINSEHDLVLTSGGTGCAPRDNTPEVTREFLERPTPGLDEAIRTFSMTKSPNAMFSRAVSGMVGQTLVINLPGSPKAVDEILERFLAPMLHPLKLASGTVTDCQEEQGKQSD